MSDSKGFLHWLFFKKWHPVPSVGSTIALFTVIGVIFVALGIVITVINNNIQEVTIYKYDQKCSRYNDTCNLTYDLDSMKAPIYFYYELENFY
jgi:phage baseplate assembly protein gpV